MLAAVVALHITVLVLRLRASFTDVVYVRVIGIFLVLGPIGLFLQVFLLLALALAFLVSRV
jgi:hypothetical protein